MSERVWNKEGIPHKGWKYVEVIDYLEENDDYFKCEMCGKEEIRYIHVLKHDDYGEIRVGCICAGKMVEDYKYAKLLEDEFKKKQRAKKRELKNAERERNRERNRLIKKERDRKERLKRSILTKLFKLVYMYNSSKSTWYAHINDEWVTIKRTKSLNYAYVFRGNWVWNLKTLEEAKSRIEDDLYEIFSREIDNE